VPTIAIAAGAEGMTGWEALILGIVEGITEYLPISSTGHLLLTERALGIAQSDAADAFAICIQAGAIVAVLGLYRERVWQMLAGLRGRDPQGRQLAIHLIAAFLPAAGLGLVLNKIIKKYLFGGDAWGLWPIVGAWFVGGVAILAVSLYRRRRREAGAPRCGLEGLTVSMAVIIGVSQCIAMWPGTSRSLVTIVGGILVGLTMSAAVEFSFLLGVLTLTAATAKDAFEHGSVMLAAYGWGPLAIGFVGAWVSAVLAVRWMVGYLHKHGLEIFGYYRIALAVVVALLLWRGVL
jgi:undecaprenyl-diphosphatase